MTEQQKKTAGIAITSLVLGIIGLLTIWLCGLGMLCAIPAVICGHIGYSRVRKSGGALAGDGMALAGLILGYICIGLLVLLIPMQLAIALPAFASARSKAQETTCKNNLRQIEVAQQHYAVEHNNAVAGWPQLVGPDAAFKQRPTCPKGGVYTLAGKPEDKPSCSLHGQLPP